MQIAVVLGSPTGRDSITLQYVRYLARIRPEPTWDLVDVGHSLHRLDRDPAFVDGIVDRLAAADAIVWAFPVYTFLAPAALVRLVERLCDRRPAPLVGRWATVLTTSEHFFDHTAHTWAEEISSDLGLRVFRGFSARMEEILAEDGRRQLDGWSAAFLQAVAEGAPAEVHHPPVRWEPRPYVPDLGDASAPTGTRRVAVITDVTDDEPNLQHMIRAFRHHCVHPVDVVQLREIGMKGACLGCLQCVWDGTCVYKDGFAEAFDTRIRAADVLVFACTLRHRYLSSTLKTYFDRNFRNGHRPVLHGKPMGWLLSGPLRQLPNLRQMLEGKNEVQGSPRLGIVTDEYDTAEEITARVAALARAADRLCAAPWIRPPTFLGVGGRKIFRDLMWSMRGIVRADHAWYARNGLYDFPQWDRGRTWFNRVMAAMMAVPWSRRWLLKNMGQLKLTAIRKVVEGTAEDGVRAR